MKNILILVALTITVCGCANQPNLQGTTDNQNNTADKLNKKAIDPANDPYNK